MLSAVALGARRRAAEGVGTIQLSERALAGRPNDIVQGASGALAPGALAATSGNPPIAHLR